MGFKHLYTIPCSLAGFDSSTLTRSEVWCYRLALAAFLLTLLGATCCAAKQLTHAAKIRNAYATPCLAECLERDGVLCQTTEE